MFAQGSMFTVNHSGAELIILTTGTAHPISRERRERRTERGGAEEKSEGESEREKEEGREV